MIFDFIKRVWLSYVLGLFTFAVILTVFFSVTSDHTSIVEMLFLLLAVAGVAGMTSLPTAMPIVFFAWLIQQRRRIVISKMNACIIGLLAGTLIHALVLTLTGSKVDTPQILMLVLLCGGGCGLTFCLIFAYRGGFEFTKQAEQGAADNPLPAE